MPELIEYYWDEIKERGEFVYEAEDGTFTTESKKQPLVVKAPSLESYWGELIWYLRTQGGC